MTTTPICRRCSHTLDPTWVACPFCGTKHQNAKKPRARRANGMGGVYRRGATWTARVTIGWREEAGKPIPVFRTKGGFKTKTEALQAIPKLQESPLTPKPTETFKQMYDRWEPFYEPRIGDSTMSGYKSAMQHFKAVWHIPIAQITVTDLQNCIDSCGRGRSTLNNMRSVVSLVFKYARQNRLKVDNLAEFLYCGAGENGTHPPLTLSELEKVKSAIPTEPYASYVVCLCYLGFRPNEFLGLRKTDYDKEHKCFVRGFKTEAGEDRIVTISPKIQPYIDRQMTLPGDYLFPRLHGRAAGSAMGDAYFRDKCFAPLMERLGITDRVPYSCRHTFANLLKAVQGSDTDKAALIGHADASMTKYYQSADYDSLRAITDVI